MALWSSYNNLGLKGKLVIPFVGILSTSIFLLGTMLIANEKSALTQSLVKKSEILIQNLSSTLADPFSMGEYDRIQQILINDRNTDEEVAYVTLVGMDGRGVASTDLSLRNVTLARNEFESSALRVTEMTRR